MKCIKTDARSGRRAVAIIYSLSDPRDGQVRYIGKTEMLSVRLRLHIWEAGRNDSLKSIWIREIVAAGLSSEVRELERVPVEDDWAEAEKRQIALARNAGAVLLNGTSGGQGVPDTARGEKWRQALRDSHINNPRRIAGAKAAAEKNRGRKHSADLIERRIANRRGVPLSPEHREKIGAAQRGKPRNPESVAKMALTKRGRKTSDEVREKLRQAMLPQRERQSRIAKANWADPVWRAKALAARKRS
ncbi:MAG: NUMOD3 domain-containing DNA-binding protein [Pseudolabrys sp.]|nr:NUMOD3 domain-containing DNA-binding protein [Pseudolabrys sp.]